MYFYLRAISFAFFPLEVLVAIFMFSGSMARRRLWPLRIVLGVVFIIGLSFLTVWLKSFIMNGFEPGYSSFKFTVSFALTTVIDLILFMVVAVVAYLTFKTDKIDIMFKACAAFAVQNIARCIFNLCCRLQNPSEPIGIMSSFIYNPINILVYIAVFAAVYALCYYLFVRQYRGDDENYLNNVILIPLLIIVFINIVFSSVEAPRDSAEANPLYLFLLIIRIAICVIGLFMQFTLLNLQKTKFEQIQTQQMLVKQKEQFEIAKDSIDSVNINAHDLKRQINVILNAVRDTGVTSDVENELNQMAEKVSVLDTAFRTGNKALDVVLTEKSRLCTNQKINFSAIADGTVLDFMTDLDIYVMFGNALDNAIDAVKKIADEGGRIISLFVKSEMNVVSVHIENTFVDAPKFVGGVLQTSKSDKRTHGFGVRSIQHIVQKYGGNMKLKAQDGIFSFDLVLLPDRK